MIILWYVFKLALILFPLHFRGEYLEQAKFIDIINNQPPSQIVYLIPIADKNKPQVTLTVTYPLHVTTGKPFIVTYEIENYFAKDELKFDLRLRSGKESFSTPIIFKSKGPTKLTGNFTVKQNSTIKTLEFQPEVSYQGKKLGYATIRQIQVHASKEVLAANIWKWVNLVIFIVTLILWFLFLIWV